MAFQRVPDTAEIVFVYTQNNETLINTVHALRIGGYSLVQITNLAVAMDGVMASDILTEVVDECTYERTEVRGLDTENDFAATVSTSSGPGDLVGPGLPNNVTLAIKRASGLTGRSARGRWFWCGLAASDLAGDENQINAVNGSQKVSQLEDLRVAIGAAGWQAVIVSRFTGGAARDPAVTFPWVTTVLVNTAIDSQRGRLSN